MERIQKVIANSGYCSRRKAEELIKNKKVFVNGNLVNELGMLVSNKDRIEVNGEIITREKKYEYYLLNKPRGVISTTSDEHNRKTVVDLIETNARIYPVGRLDYDTTGLIILTNDGVLANKLMHPSSNIDKTYVAKINGIVKGYDIKKLRNGVIIDGVKTSKARVKLKEIDKKKETSIVELSIHEGRNHQVKKMFDVLGYKVLKLTRIKYAIFDVKGLRVGEYRKLNIKEVNVLYSLVGNANKR